MRVLFLLLLLAISPVARGAIAITSRAGNGDTTNTNTFTTASFTPTANSLLVACFSGSNASSTDPTLATVSGGSLTWTNVGDFKWISSGTSRARSGVWAALVGGSPSSMTVNALYGASITGAAWSVFDVTGTDVANTGVAAQFVQVVNSTANATGTSLSITLAAAANSNNRSFFFVAHAANEGYTVATGWAQISAGSYATPNMGVDSQWKSASFDTSPNTSWTTSSNFGGIAWEMKALVVFRNRYGTRSRFMQ